MKLVLYRLELIDQLVRMIKSSDKGFTPQDRRSKLNGLSHLTGFTLIELLLTINILAFCLCGVLLTYINMFILSDLSRDITLATNSLQAKMEEIKKTNFDNLSSLNGTTFNIAGFASSDAKGRIEVYNVTLRPTPTETLKRVRIVVCFKSRGRIIGEDKNLNGILDSGEDKNMPGEDGYNRLDSPMELLTLIAKTT